MIALHRLTHPDQVFFLNPDLIATIEATPDTVVSLTNSSRFIVHERPEQIIELIREWRAGILARSLEINEGVDEKLADVVHLAGSRPEAAAD